MTVPFGLDQSQIDQIGEFTGGGTGTGASTPATTPTAARVPQPTPVPIPPIRGDNASAYCGKDIIADDKASTVDESGEEIQPNNLYRGFYQNWALAQLKRVQDRKFDILCLDYKRCGGTKVDCFQFEDQWRDCKTRRIKRSDLPDSYLEIKFSNGTTCWEENTPIKFSPDLAEALFFRYHRGNEVPRAANIKVFNPSGGRAYSLSFVTNQEIVFTPSSFTIMPRETKTFNVVVPLSLLDKIGDGLAKIELEILVNEIG